MRRAAFVCWVIAGVLGRAAANETLRLDHPEGLCYDRAGRLYVADTNHHRVLVFSPKLALVRTIGKEGGRPGEMRRPADVAVDDAGRIVVVEAGNHRVQVFSPAGKSVRVVGGPREGAADGQFRRPTKVTTDENGHLLVTDTHNHRLQVFDRDGKHVFTLANRTGPAPRAILKPGKDGRKVARDWLRTDPGQLNEPGGVFYDRKLKRLYLANGWNCRAEVLDYDSQTGRITRRPTRTGIVWGWWITRGIAGDAAGRLIGCDTGFGKLNVFEDRANLTDESKKSRTVDGGTYGRLREIHDVAVSPGGDVAVTDTANDRIVIYPPGWTLPEHPRVELRTRTEAVVTWQTLRPAPTKARLRQGEHPERTPGHERPWETDTVREIVAPGPPTKQHRLTVTGLKPSARYYYRLAAPGLRSIPGGGTTREYAVATLPAAGRTTFVRIPVKLLLMTNVADASTAAADAPLPQPMPPEEIELYQAAFRETQRFYWCNSSMRYWLDLDVYVDPTLYRTGADGPHTPDAIAKLPRENADLSFRKVLKQAGKSEKVYTGRVVCKATRRWNAARKAWEYQGSGGGTYGVQWPTEGRSHFLGGSDVAWLLCHEYKHQLESQYSASGLDREDDRSIFCHFAPIHAGWKWCTAFDHGEHWDGIAWQLRHFTADQYFRNLYGEIASAADADEDGIPDDDPRVPLDEKRFGSSPARRDTDGDGLDDMEEVLASRWVRALNTALRQRVPGKWPRPDPTKADSDGDGMPDGKDKYPLYPFRPVIRRATAKVDGALDEWPKTGDYRLDHAGVKLAGWAGWDREHLYYAFRLRGAWRKITLVVDQDADGFYVGNDNVYAELAPDRAAGARKANVRMHLCNRDRWPFFDNRHEHARPDAFPFAARRDGEDVCIELACPRSEACGLKLTPGEEIGMALYIGLPDKGAISLFEPWNLFDSVLAE